jgi:hypothetical protein
MRAKLVSLGLLEIDGTRYDRDVVIDGADIRRRKKGQSKTFRDRYGHTPLSADEEIPWGRQRLIIGTGANGRLPIMPEVQQEADRRGITITACPTREACRLISQSTEKIAAILHVTC